MTTPPQTISAYEDIDWQRRWRQSRAGKSWKSKDAGEWDRKAAAFADRTRDSAYVDQFLGFLDLNPDLSVLDVGCGPGTLALPLAARVGRVTALDYSRGMLDLLEAEAAERGLNNIRTVHGAWEDDWSTLGIDRHDLVIASRSMNIDDLAGALATLNRFAIRQVHIAERIAPSPFDPDAFAALERPFNSGPDYIFTLNMLHRMGIHPRVERIELAREVRFDDFDQALRAYTWMFRDLSPAEEARLEQFLKKRIIIKEPDHLVIRRDHPQRWALLSWSTE